MARVGVDETIYASVPLVQMITGWHYPTIIGHLVLLWRFSQDKMRISGTAEEICDWAFVQEGKDIFIKGLLRAGFIKAMPCLSEDATSNATSNATSILVESAGTSHPVFLISGNEKHIRALNNYRERAKKAAEARWSKSNIEAPEPKKMLADATSMLVDAPCDHYSNLFYSNLGFSKKKNTAEKTESKTPPENAPPQKLPKPKKSPKKGKAGIYLDYPHEFIELWEAYGGGRDKKEGYEVYKQLSLSPERITELKKAITNYCIKNPDKRFRKAFFRYLKTDWREDAKDTQGEFHLNGNLPVPGNGKTSWSGFRSKEMSTYEFNKAQAEKYAAILQKQQGDGTNET